MLRASRALLRDDREIDLKPWLFRLTRNCALDELSRVKGGVGAARRRGRAHRPGGARRRPSRRSPASGAPACASSSRTSRRCPRSSGTRCCAASSTASSHEEIARELGLTEQSTKSLVFRARANLVREREARTEDCTEVRMQLLEAADAHRRATPQTLRHVAKCPACREFRAGAQGLAPRDRDPRPRHPADRPRRRRRRAALARRQGRRRQGGRRRDRRRRRGRRRRPRHPGLRPRRPLARSPSAARPSPPAALAARQPVPRDTAIVRQTLLLPAGAAAREQAVITCPAPLRVADLLPPTGAKLRVAYAPATIVGESRVARIALTGPPLARDTRVTVVRPLPPADGGRVDPRRRPAHGGARRRTACACATSCCACAPTAQARGSVRRGQPVTRRPHRGLVVARRDRRRDARLAARRPRSAGDRDAAARDDLLADDDLRLPACR